MTTDNLLPKVKANLILAHDADDGLLLHYIKAAVSYAESYQHVTEGYYTENTMPPTTEQAVIMLASHFYESREMARRLVSFRYVRGRSASLEHGEPTSTA